MSKEDKILEILAAMQKDMAAMKADINSLKNGDTNNHNTGELDDEGVRRQLETLNKMKNLLSDEEKEAFGKYMDAEEERKNKLYA